MIDQNLISAGAPLVGRGLFGFAIGFAIRKIMKLAFIGLGLLVLLYANIQMELQSYLCSYSLSLS